MKQKPVVVSIINFYLEGFREMIVGKTRWLILPVKLFILFFIQTFKTEKQEYVSAKLIERAINP